MQNIRVAKPATTKRIETALEMMNGELGIPLFPHRVRATRYGDFKLVWHAFSAQPRTVSGIPMSACGEIDFTDAELPVRMPAKIANLCEDCTYQVGESRMLAWQESGTEFLQER